MNCGICSQDIGEMIILLPVKQHFGFFDVMSCLDCARKSNVFCVVHDAPHVAWGLDMTRCHECAMELTDKNMGRAKTLIGIVEDAATEDFKILNEEKCMPFLSEEEKDRVIIFFFASSALAMKIEFDELIHRIVSAGTLEILKNP